MSDSYRLTPIAHVCSDFPDKFGIPRQSGLVKTLQSTILFEPKYRDPNAFKGLDGFSHLWLIWAFSENQSSNWTPMVRPPRLGGNIRMGVFATRSPFRPNPIGLSAVKLERIEFHPKFGPILHISGADLMDGTPIFDIKPYVPYVDAYPDALEGFGGPMKNVSLEVICPEEFIAKIPEGYQTALFEVLSQDPRPAYQQDPERIYSLRFAGMEIKFRVEDQQLTICDIRS